MPKGAICAEIGVWKADFSRKILLVTRPKQLHLIDPWAFQPEFAERMYGGSVARAQADMDRIHARVVRRLGRRPEVRIHRAFSAPAAKLFPDGFFDWLYIDGNHEYEFVKADLELYLPKVKPGGLICGDDYDWNVASGYPVRRAVDEFVASGLATPVEIRNSQFILRTLPTSRAGGREPR